jgi:hypothetical protein
MSRFWTTFGSVLVVMSQSFIPLNNAYGADEEQLAVVPRGGEVLRIPAFDLRKPAAEWTAGRLFECQRGDGGVGFYEINRTSFSANTVRLKPNRSYLLSVLLQADFERPTEVNVGLRTLDAGGKNVIDNLIGLPNKTNGWERGCRDFRVISARPYRGGKLIRRRECRYCGKRITTREQAIGYTETA